jgi:hypothetical protein
MTSDRPYRRALPFSIAWEEISRGCGLQFDPEVVQVFQLVPKTIWEDIRRWESVDHVAGEGRPSITLRFPLNGLIALGHTSYE